MTERGSIMALAAVMVVVLSVFGGLAWGAGMLYGANQEGRRATDLAAAAGAANLPTVVVGPTTQNPLDTVVPSETGGLPAAAQLDRALKRTSAVSGPLPGFSSDWLDNTCEVAHKQFGSGGGDSMITDNWGSVDWSAGSGDCTVTTGLANSWLESIAKCVQNVGATSGCLGSLQNDVNNAVSSNPADSVVKGSALESKYNQALSKAGAAGTLVTLDLVNQLKALNDNPPLLHAVLKGKLQPLIDKLTPLVNAPLPTLAPTMFTPYVTVDLTQHMSPPGAGLVGDPNMTVHNQSTARRYIKNAVLVPAITPPDPVTGAFSITPPINGVTGLLPTTPIQPTCTTAQLPGQVNLNPCLAQAQNPILDALQGVDSQLGAAMDDAMVNKVCPTFTTVCNPKPPKPSEPMADVYTDAREVDNPPPGYPAPDPNANIATQSCLDPKTLQQVPACDPTKRPVLVAASSIVQNPRQILGDSIWADPLVQALVPGLLFAPAEMVVPAVLSVQPDKSIVANPLPYANNLATAAGESKGLYRARLVDK